MTNSKFVGIRKLSSTPHVSCKSGRLQKHNRLSLLMRSDKGKENLSSSSSGSKQRVRELNLFQTKSNSLKRKKKDNLMQARVVSEKVNACSRSVGTHKKRMTGRVFKSLFKKRRTNETVPDIGREQEGLHVSHACTDRATVSENVGKLDVGSCVSTIPVLGESKVSLQWKHTRARGPRKRMRLQYLDGAPKNDVEKKRRRTVVENVDPALDLVELQGHEATQVGGSKEGPSVSSPNDISGESSFSPQVDTSGAEERNAPCDEQKSLHTSLQGEIEKLCQILKLSEDVTCTMRRFVEYVILNHHVNRDSPPIMQAFQVSVYWVAASILKQEIDKSKSLILAQQFLCYQCTVEQVESAYSKMRHLKRGYLESSLNTIDSLGDHLSAEEHIKKDTVGANQQSSIFSSVKMNVEENLHKRHDGGQILLQQKRALKDKASASEIDNLISKTHKQCDKRMKKLIQKQRVEIQEFHRIWEEKKSELEKAHKVESALKRYLYRSSAQLESNLELLDGKYAKIKEENNLLMEMQLKDLEVKHLAAMNEEKEKAAHWLAEANACCSSELSAVDGAQSLGSDSEDKNPSKTVSMQGNDVKPSDKSISAPAEEAGCDAPIGTPVDLVCTDRQTSGRSLLPVFEQINHPPENYATGETFCANLPHSEERVPDETRSAELNKEVPPEVPESDPCETVDHVNPVELSNDFNSNRRYDKGDTIGFPDALVSQRDGIDENPIGVSCLASKVLEVSEATEDSPYPQNEVGVAFSERSVLAVAQQLNQPKSFATGDIIGVNLAASGDSVPDETRSVQLNKEVPPQVLEIVPCETVDSVNSVQLSDASNEKYDKGDTIGLPDVLLNQRDQNDETAGGVSCVAGQIVEPSAQTQDSPSPQNEVCVTSSERSTLPVDEQLNQSNRLTTGEISGLNLPASGDIVPEIRSHELNNAVPPKVPEDQSQQSLPAELQDQGAKVVEKQNTPLLQVAASEVSDTSSVPQSSTVLQDRDALIIDNHGTLQTEVTNPPLVATMTAPLQSNIERQVSENCEQLHLVSNDVNPSCHQSTDIEVENQIHDLGRNSCQTAEVAETEVLLQETASRLGEYSEIQPNHLDIGSSSGAPQSNIDRQVSENCEQLHLVSNDVNPSCHQSTDIAVENQIHDLGRNSSQTAEVAETEVLLQESASRLGEYSEIQPNHLDIGSSSGAPQETSVELLPSYNNMAVSQGAVGTVNILNQPVLPQGVNVGHPRDLFSHPNHQATYWNSASVMAPPLQNELERIRKETEQLDKSHKDMILQLKSDCQKKIEEVYSNYEVQRQNAEAEYRLKRNTLNENEQMVRMNSMLGEAFSLGMRPGSRSSFTQYLHQPLLAHPVRLSNGSSTCQPAPTNNQTVQVLQQLSLSHPARNFPQNIAAPPAQAAQPAMSSPQFVSSATNHQPPPHHLRAFGSTTLPSISQYPQQHSQPLQLPLPAVPPPQNFAAPAAQASQHAMVFSSTYISRPQLVSSATNHQPPPHDLRSFGHATWPSISQYPQQQPQHPRPLQFPSPAVPPLQYNPEHRQLGPRSMWSQSLCGIRSNFGSVGSSSMGTLGSGQGNQTSSAVANDVVCLSD